MNYGIIISIGCNSNTAIKHYDEHNSELIFQHLKKEIAENLREYHKYGKKFERHIQLTVDIFPYDSENQLNIFPIGG